MAIRSAVVISLAFALACSSHSPVGNDAGTSKDAGTNSDAGAVFDAGVGGDGGILYSPFACADAGAGSPFDRQESFTAADGSLVQITICGPSAGTALIALPPGDDGPSAALFNSALAALDGGPGTLLLSPGNYDFAASDAGVNWAINNAHDLIIDGQGATLTFHGLKEGIAVSHAQRLLIRNLVVDWGDALAAGGTLQSDAAACDGGLSFVAGADYPQDATSPMPIRSLSQFDLATPGWPLESFQQAHWAQSTALAPNYVGGQTYCLGDPQVLASLPSGTQAVAIARTNGANAVQITGSSDVSLENVTVYASPAEAIAFVNGGRGMRMSQCRVLRKAQDPLRLISSNADGVNFRQTLGSIVLEDSEFADQGDDGISVVGMFFQLQAGSTPTSLLLTPGTAVPGIVVGDQLVLEESSTYAQLGTAQVAQVTALQDGGVTVGAQIDLVAPGFTAIAANSYGGAAGELLDGGLLAVNPARSSPNFIVRNVHVHDNDERAMLVHSANGLVDHCQFENDLGMLLLAQDSVFFEGPGASNVIVQDSTFTHCDAMAPGQTSWACAGGSLSSAPAAPLSVASITSDSNYSFGAPNQQIVLQRNVINGAPGAGLLVASASQVTLLDNLLNDTNQVPLDAGCGRFAVLPQGSIIETQSSQVSASGNSRDGGTSLGFVIGSGCQGCASQAGY